MNYIYYIKRNSLRENISIERNVSVIEINERMAFFPRHHSDGRREFDN